MLKRTMKAIVVALFVLVSFRVYSASTSVPEPATDPCIPSPTTITAGSEKTEGDAGTELTVTTQAPELPIGMRAHAAIASGPFSDRLNDGYLRVNLEDLNLPKGLEPFIVRFIETQNYDEIAELLFKVIVRYLSIQTNAPEVMVFTREEWPSYGILHGHPGLAPGLGSVTLAFDPFTITLMIGPRVYYKTAISEE